MVYYTKIFFIIFHFEIKNHHSLLVSRGTDLLIQIMNLQYSWCCADVKCSHAYQKNFEDEKEYMKSNVMFSNQQIINQIKI